MMEERKHERNQFTFYSSFLDAVNSLPKHEQGRALRAIVVYGLDREEMPLKGSAKGIFAVVRPVLEAGWKKAMMGSLGGLSPHFASQANGKQDESKIKNKINIKNKIKNNCSAEEAAEGRRRLDEDERRAVEALLRGDY